MIAHEAICTKDDRAEIYVTEFGAARPEVRRSAAHRLITGGKADQLPLRVNAQALKCLVIVLPEVKQVHLRGRMAADRLEVWAFTRENFPRPRKLRFQPTVAAQYLV